MQSEKVLFMKKAAPYVLLPVLLFCYLILKYRTHTQLDLLLGCLLLGLGYLAAWGDIKEQKIPNKLILLMLASWILALIPQMFLGISEVWSVAIRGIAGFLFCGFMMLTVYLISKKGLGGGDVKFVASAGCYLGIANTLSAVLFGSILAAVVGIVMIVTKKRKKTDSFPFVPYLYAGMALLLFLS